MMWRELDSSELPPPSGDRKVRDAINKNQEADGTRMIIIYAPLGGQDLAIQSSSANPENFNYTKPEFNLSKVIFKTVSRRLSC